MNEVNAPLDHVGYEYKKITAKNSYYSFCLDGYESFGWKIDKNVPAQAGKEDITVMLMRNRHLVNKVELTRLQRNFDACVEEIQVMQRAKTSTATIWALAVGLIGTVFMALSVFAVVAPNPNYPLSVILAIPAFAGWIAPVFLYRWMVRRKTKQIDPLIEEKYEEAYALCERGQHLLPH